MSLRPRLPGPLRMVFQAGPHAVAECPTPEGLPVPLVELTVFADDCIASGRLALTADRVTDLMNQGTEFEFVDVSLESLGDGHELQVRTVAIAREEILAVAVAGPRGDRRRRTRTRPNSVELRVGRYDVSGNIHTPPGADPIIDFARRGVMVPLTEATIVFDAPDGRMLSRIGTILVNRELTTWIRPEVRSDVRPLEVAPTPRRRRAAKDFTPLLLGRGR